MAISAQLNIPAGMAAGAIIAGAVFGDKMSPLSDTTNLAALVTKVNIFSHIRAMIWTTVPASIIGLIVWYFAGLQFKGNANTSQVNAMLKELSTIYNINFFVWLPLIIIIVCLLFKISTVLSMLISSVSAIVIGAFNNGFKVTDGFKATFDGFNKSMVPNLHGSLSEKAINLIEQGGMMSMTEIVVTIFCGYAFAGIVEKAGCLDVILKKISSNINSVGTLILATVVGGLMMVLAAGVASVVIIMVGVLMMDMYNKMGLDRSNLSRTLEDSGTMIIPLIPWGTSGIYYT
ncbi:Na+/H+ antiporter NhaC, partial [Staphylococcus aureus]|uniref:Na+/H+ antiporter NhaC family protein n=1 Tax=Staphylococcus aureus TaxID=1280 RepID=UPI002872BC92